MMSHHQSSFAASVNHDASHMELSSTTYNILTSYIHHIYIYINMHICIYTHSPHSILYNHMNGYIGLWTITTLESSRAPGPGTSPRSPGHIMASMVACFCASSLSFACLSCASQHQSTVKIGQRCHAGFNCQTRKGFWFLGCILSSGMNQQELCQKTEKEGKLRKRESAKYVNKNMKVHWKCLFIARKTWKYSTFFQKHCSVPTPDYQQDLPWACVSTRHPKYGSVN